MAGVIDGVTRVNESKASEIESFPSTKPGAGRELGGGQKPWRVACSQSVVVVTPNSFPENKRPRGAAFFSFFYYKFRISYGEN